MNFKVDENLPVEVTEILRNRGHGAVTVMEHGLWSSSDRNLASICQHEARAMMVTLDLDFGDIRSYPLAEYRGIIAEA